MVYLWISKDLDDMKQNHLVDIPESQKKQALKTTDKYGAM